MARTNFKPGNMLYPVPAVLISCSDGEGKDNVFTVAWAGTICSDPAMLSISVRKERFSHAMITKTGEFVVNLVGKDLVEAVDYCGVKSGRDTDKWADMKLTKLASEKVAAPSVAESPVSIECKVKQVLELGSHDMFIAEVVAVTVDDKYMDETGKFHFADAKPVAYSHGEYYSLGENLGKFGYSVKKK
ncbi:MAG: flavin reductase family protein [Lachnospiraceae bacterium]|nr:flavin reductase family protein [Lachnospiraceae bacterium]